MALSGGGEQQLIHFTIHAAPGSYGSLNRAGSWEIDGALLEVLAITATDLPPLSVTFEEAAERLSALPRMFFEPDGSFVWVSAFGPAWQLDGQLQDRGPALDYLELKGKCAAEPWERLLHTLGWPQQELVFQIVREGIFVDERNLRQLLLVHESG